MEKSTKIIFRNHTEKFNNAKKKKRKTMKGRRDALAYAAKLALLVNSTVMRHLQSEREIDSIWLPLNSVVRAWESLKSDEYASLASTHTHKQSFTYTIEKNMAKSKTKRYTRSLTHTNTHIHSYARLTEQYCKRKFKANQNQK